MPHAILDIVANEIAGRGSLPLAFDLPDGGRTVFTAVGQTEPSHAPRYRLIDRAVTTPEPDYPFAVTAETLQVVDGCEEIARTYAPDAAAYQRAIEQHVDAAARARSYSGGVSLASYAASTNALWQAEALAFIAWRDAVWTHALAQLALVEAGQSEAPALEAFLVGLPTLVWPEN